MPPGTPGSWLSRVLAPAPDVPGANRNARKGRATRPPAGVRFGLNSRRAAVVAVAICALVLAIAVPLRTYLGQRQQLADTVRTQAQLSAEVTQLQSQLGRLQDPAYVQSQARERLRYVTPGETPYQVQLPADVAQATGDNPPAPRVAAPWFSSLWATVIGSGG